MEDHNASATETPARRLPWKKGKLLGAKPPPAESRLVDRDQAADAVVVDDA